MTQVWVNQQTTINVSPFDRGLAYGDGVFATMRTYPKSAPQSGIMLLKLHLARLAQGCERLHINWGPSETLISHLSDLAQQYPNSCIKLLLTRGVGGRGYQAPEQANITEITSVHEIPIHYQTWQKQGVALATSKIKLAQQPLLAGIKHLNRLEQVLIKSQQLPDGFNDWLVYDTQDNVIEASMANIFIVKAEQVFTPAINQAGVSGVMREAVIEALLSNGVDVRIQPLSLNDIVDADSIMLTNSLFGIINVIKVDKNSYQPWANTIAVAQKLQTTLS
ncbi:MULTISPECIES: aminodeoxychorismate lyase [Pseudomonadati]|uniref:Aminodeoxychorismate lyase n=1 Tax=Shewanella aestuarii TaxID=1028752 RepID=A0ABT0KWP6_9GAMM|nr:aminodeoxychorismate lyase [Shewanella aestuarii]MCL1115887.1 aminodeoxychorismate lyase [Shewanella aestuarii]GGN69345.1 4-amino-4-deoxychorismate lyase [Shewanella aestuarii]